MGIFSNLFDTTRAEIDDKSSPWKSLTSEEQLEELLQQSLTHTVVIFKHSTRCGISSIIWKRFQTSIPQEASTILPYYLDLLQYRNVSNAIADRFEIRHQSPQVLVIRNHSVVAHASHYDITSLDMLKYQ